MKPPSRAISPRELRLLATIVIALLVFAGALFALNYRLLGALGSGGEFLTMWVGSRSFLFEGIDPYGGSVPAHVQPMVYGRPAGPGEEPYILDMPFHLLILVFPLALVPDPVVARSLFTLVLEVALLGSVYLSLRLAGWTSARAPMALFVIGALLSFYTFTALSEDSPAIVLGFLYLSMLWALSAEKYELAGALIVLGTFRWELGAPLLAALGLYGARRGSGRMWAGFALLGVLLFAISIFLYPGWLIPLWRAVSNNLRFDYGFTMGGVLSRALPHSAEVVRWIITGGLLMLIGREAGLAQGGTTRALHWAAFIILTATPFLGQRSEMEDLVVLVFAWPLLLRAAWERWGKTGGIPATLLMVCVFLGPWWLDMRGAALGGLDAPDLAFLLLPLATMLGLYWMRWWALHAPRTWTQKLADS